MDAKALKINNIIKTDLESLYQKELSPEELLECKGNLFGFFKLLAEIDKELKQNEN